MIELQLRQRRGARLRELHVSLGSISPRFVEHVYAAKTPALYMVRQQRGAPGGEQRSDEMFPCGLGVSLYSWSILRGAESGVLLGLGWLATRETRRQGALLWNWISVTREDPDIVIAIIITTTSLTYIHTCDFRDQLIMSYTKLSGKVSSAECYLFKPSANHTNQNMTMPLTAATMAVLLFVC